MYIGAALENGFYQVVQKPQARALQSCWHSTIMSDSAVQGMMPTGYWPGQ
jgi:hypothetical protein